MIRLFVTISLFVALSACSGRAGNEFGSPESATYGMLDALASARSDPDTAWEFLDEATKDELERRAHALKDNGVTLDHPVELLRIGSVPGRADIKRIERVRVTSSEAELKLHTYLGEVFPLTLHRDGSRWTVSLVEN